MKNLPANEGDKRFEFNLWVGTSPWRREWQPMPVFLLGITWTDEPGRLQSMGLN